MNKKRIVLLFGGQSSEHVVSCMSVLHVAEQMDKDKYEMFLIGITEEGHWIKADSILAVRDDSWRNGTVGAVLSPDATEKCVILFKQEGVEKIPVDAVFPVLHGFWGEDGTIQGLLEMARLPYVGCGVLASAVSMDKLFTKIIVDELGICQADYVPVAAAQLEEDLDGVVSRVERRFPYPVFVKPANSGSSRGINKAENQSELIAGLREAAKFDRKLLVEEMIDGREIECAVLGGGTRPVLVSGVGEILPAAEFYDFDAKYYSEESKTVMNPELPGDCAERIRKAAAAVFRAVDGYGLARVDFFVTPKGDVIFNEINTMPGFTGISMYPKLWQAEGMSKQDLITSLIELGFERYN